MAASNDYFDLFFCFWYFMTNKVMERLKMKTNQLNNFKAIDDTNLQSVNGGYNRAAHTIGHIAKVGIAFLPLLF
ncbi:ComC/BlpC family leader-containing pheromone/bacteriocin [Bombilactobacillus thymidiniphilus]|uniref:ComC/BlpC family leader-containing pheromone/bacteriocin n=1 Tax=Bombilactobacillus thymidiniphilus TaxID=2923363 RepID=A0ABY4PD08_9LACO|nr:ComC/BlpC family leader-containing pheromone/bacteriocin [Bombilactobacillus thymidiniphilus]UQS83594.1 ComC/BlpC family leader-containing pheromone/bacteriocin [Bombilactobacillus thymidiniphilus]UQS83653.1 ComC/BlpC family leader-containing pheromone/bacteriocin [Bombilactobacillus thymidiniphilus]